MPDLKMWINKREITVHCPGCGKTTFFKPKSFGEMWEEWNRCKNCNLDIRFEDKTIVMVMEEVFYDD